MKYYQCKLMRPHIMYGELLTTSWLPEKYAKKGTIVKLKDVDGWEVMDVGSLGMEEEQVRERSQDHKNTRKASDI